VIAPWNRKTGNQIRRAQLLPTVFCRLALFSLREHAPHTHAQLRSSSSRAQRLQPINPRHSLLDQVNHSLEKVAVHKRNALRHSFGSYRMEQIKNEGQVALEMGNSPKVVKDHYFEMVDEPAAREHTADFKEW